MAPFGGLSLQGKHTMKAQQCKPFKHVPVSDLLLYKREYQEQWHKSTWNAELKSFTVFL